MVPGYNLLLLQHPSDILPVITLRSAMARRDYASFYLEVTPAADGLSNRMAAICTAGWVYPSISLIQTV